MKGLFTVFEGIDGSGKSTQILKLAKHIFEISKYNHVVITREPWKDENIRKMLRETKNPYSQAEELAKMYVEDRKEHFKNLILPAIEKGIHVVSDRYSFSTLAYQQTQGIPLTKLLEMHKGLPIPDITFIIDIPVDVAQKRMKKDLKNGGRKIEQKFERNIPFLEKLREKYLELASLPNYNVVVVDGTKKPDEIFEKQIKPIFEEVYSFRKTL